MKVSLLIQARMGSSRLPKKVLMNLNDQPALKRMIHRLNSAKTINEIIVCTSINHLDDALVDFCQENEIKYFRGDENDLLKRFYDCALLLNSDFIVRCTADCPLIDPAVVDQMVTIAVNEKLPFYDFDYPTYDSCFPDGFDVEVLSFQELKEANKLAKLPSHREHLTTYLREKHSNRKRHPIDLDIIQKLYPDIDLRKLHLSLDSYGDYLLLNTIYLHFKNQDFTINQVLDYLNKNPTLITLQLRTNPPTKGQDLYLEAKKMIPGGTQLLSKRPELFLPDQWPAYYRKANGIEITTLDGIKYKDFCYMSIGTNILGYQDPDVNRAVHQSVDNGNMSTLNSPKEVELTRLLTTELHPWAQMARYARSGGESCAIAVRIARAHSKKDQLAFCGYHGWHDWYLSANHNTNDNSSLNNHLLTGLSPSGVPKALANTAFPFRYNHLEELEEIIKNQDIGTIIMEPRRGEEPRDNFLKKIRDLCDQNNLVLIFDEISSGFRINTGGIHLLYDVNPDIAIFGKAISNGYPIGAIIGKKEVMCAAENTFISSTYWTEDLGYAATLATIRKYRDLNVGNYLETMGNYFIKNLKEVAEETGIKIEVSGLPSMMSFNFEYEDPTPLAIKTLYVQLMLERNILAKNALYLSYAHKKDDIDYYLSNIREVFGIMKKAIDDDNVLTLLKGPIAHAGFKRLA